MFKLNKKNKVPQMSLTMKKLLGNVCTRDLKNPITFYCSFFEVREQQRRDFPKIRQSVIDWTTAGYMGFCAKYPQGGSLGYGPEHARLAQGALDLMKYLIDREDYLEQLLKQQQQ